MQRKLNKSTYQFWKRKTESYIKIDQLVDILIVLAICILPRLFLCMYTYPVRTIQDEIATMAAAAVGAGRDWTNVIKNTSYYGFGMSFLFAPVMRLEYNPIILYRILTCICSIIQGSNGFIALHILKKYLDVKDRKLRILLASLSSYMVVTRGTIIYNEHALILFSWIMVWILLYLEKNIHNVSNKIKGTLVLTFTLSYSLTLHTRAVTFGISVVLLTILYKILYKEWVVHLPAFCSVAAILMMIVRYFIKKYQTMLWHPEKGSLGNTKVSIVSPNELCNLDALSACVKIIIGQISTLTIVSGGIFIVGTVAWFILVKERLDVCNRIEEKGKNGNLKSRLFIIGGYSLFCIGMTIIAQAISPGWLLGVIQLLQSNNNKSGYSFKAMTYIRYVGPYIGPLIMMGMVYLNIMCKKRNFVIIRRSAEIIIIIEYIWINHILPHMYECSDASEAFLPFTFGKAVGKSNEIETFLYGTIMLLIIYFVFWMFYRKNYQLIGILLIGVLYIYQYFYNGINHDIWCQKANYLKVNASYELIENLEKKITLPKELYVYDIKEESVHKNYYLYQFYFRNYRIIPEIPKKDNAILFINKEDMKGQLLDEGYLYIQLDQNEFMFVRGKEIQQMMISQNVFLQK